MDDMIKIAGIQTEPVILDKEKNLNRCMEMVRKTAAEGAKLIIFPEAALSGYVYDSLEDALPVTEPVPGPSTERMLELCRELNVYVIFGMIEEDGKKYYNSAVFAGPAGLVGKYRKLHLPYLGIDRFLNHGDLAPQVYDTEVGRIGIGICYDVRFPESVRVLSLMGAEIIVIITNWPWSVEFVADHIVPTRAFENLVYLVAVNRVGEERGVKFFGRSKIVDFMGKDLVEGKLDAEDILYAEITPALAREKHKVLIPGVFEADFMRDRRPEFYGAITKPLDDTSRIR